MSSRTATPISVISLALKPMLIALIIQSTGIPVTGQPAQWRGTRKVEAGVEQIRNPSEGLWDQNNSKTIRVEKVLSIGNADSGKDYLFSWIKDIATDAKGNIYTCDSKLNRIQVYDSKGKFIRTIGGEGKGPGDLMRPMALTIDSAGFIYVLDDLNRRISIFNSTGGFFKLINYHVNGFATESIARDDQDNILLSHVVFGQDDRAPKPIITEYHKNGEIGREYGIQEVLLDNDGSGNPVYESYGFCMGSNGCLMVKSTNRYAIRFYRDGKLLKVVRRDSPVFTKPEITRMAYTPPNGPGSEITGLKVRSRIWQLLALPDGRFVAVIRDSGKNFKENNDQREFTTSLDLFDRDGYFLKSFPWDWKKMGLVVHVDRKGFFYSNYGETEDVIGVSKWKVTFE